MPEMHLSHGTLPAVRESKGVDARLLAREGNDMPLHSPFPPISHPARRSLLTLGLTVLLASCLLTSCSKGPGEPSQDELRAEVQKLLETAYCPKLGEAYGQGNAAVLEAVTVPKEISRISRRIEELADEGRTYEPTFKQVTVESVSTWNYSNAFATTVEVWDVRSYSIGSSRQLINEQVGQRSRVKYQLKRQDSDGSWIVLYRELAETL